MQSIYVLFDISDNITVWVSAPQKLQNLAYRHLVINLDSFWGPYVPKWIKFDPGSTRFGSSKLL